MRLHLPASTVETVEARVRVDGGATDPTTWPVEFALIDAELEEPQEADWADATWAVGGPPYLAQAQVTGSPGSFRFWLRITAPGGDVPVRSVGIIEFE